MNIKCNKRLIRNSLFAMIGIIIYLMYIEYYYDSIVLKSFVSHTVVSLNIVLDFLKNTVIALINSINDSVLKLAILSIIVIYAIDKFQIMKLLNRIVSVEVKDVKIEMQKIQEKKDEEEKKIERLKLENQSESNSSEIENAEKRNKVMQVIIDNPNIVNIISMFINKGMRSVSIPMNLIPFKYKLEVISVFFEYKVKSGSIRIFKFREEIEPIVVDIFNELIAKNIVGIDV